MNYREAKKPSKATHVAYAVGSRYENPTFLEPYEPPTEEEIQEYLDECEDVYGRPASLAIEIGISWTMDKLNESK